MVLKAGSPDCGCPWPAGPVFQHRAGPNDPASEVPPPPAPPPSPPSLRPASPHPCVPSREERGRPATSPSVSVGCAQMQGPGVGGGCHGGDLEIGLEVVFLVQSRWVNEWPEPEPWSLSTFPRSERGSPSGPGGR